MHLVKGFITSPTFINNTVGMVSKIGELSKDSLTYAKETGIYSNKDVSDVTLYTFKATDDGLPIVLPLTMSNELLDLGGFIYANCLNQHFTPNEVLVKNIIQVEFAERIENLNIGNVIGDGDFWIPEWVSFKLPNFENYIKFWLVDTSFSTQYDETEYKIIPPIANLDLFFSPRADVERYLAENSFTNMVTKVGEIADKEPYTILNASEFNWVNPLLESDVLNTPWLVLVYGRYGDNIDLIKNTLIEWVLANSTHTKEEWIDLIPDLFKVNEFIIAPFWHQFAIPNQTVQAGFNSPMVDLNDLTTVTDLVCKGVGYDSMQIITGNTVVCPSPIRNLAFSATGNNLNKATITTLKDIIPDFINVPLSSIDFSRMKLPTQNWVNMFINLLIVADGVKDGIVEVLGYQKVTRNGIVYVNKTFDSVNYLMVTKESMIDALGIQAPYFPDFAEECGCSVEGALLLDHIRNYINPHMLTSDDVGLGNLIAGTEVATPLSIAVALSSDVLALRAKIPV